MSNAIGHLPKDQLFEKAQLVHLHNQEFKEFLGLTEVLI